MEHISQLDIVLQWSYSALPTAKGDPIKHFCTEIYICDAAELT